MPEFSLPLYMCVHVLQSFMKILMCVLKALPLHAFYALQPGHAWLSQHYKWGLNRIFLEEGHSHVIIIEDDMIFSPDFLTFFQVTFRCECAISVTLRAPLV